MFCLVFCGFAYLLEVLVADRPLNVGRDVLGGDKSLLSLVVVQLLVGQAKETLSVGHF